MAIFNSYVSLPEGREWIEGTHAGRAFTSSNPQRWLFQVQLARFGDPLWLARVGKFDRFKVMRQHNHRHIN
jgi:hypothetical protein